MGAHRTFHCFYFSYFIIKMEPFLIRGNLLWRRKIKTICKGQRMRHPAILWPEPQQCYGIFIFIRCFLTAAICIDTRRKIRIWQKWNSHFLFVLWTATSQLHEQSVALVPLGLEKHIEADLSNSNLSKSECHLASSLFNLYEPATLTDTFIRCNEGVK